MHYMGSKARHAKEIIAITCKDRKPGQYYVEPFVGGGNVICKVDPTAGPRIANDKNRFMIALLDSMGNHNWEPPETMTKEQWWVIKRLKPDKITDREQAALYAFAATGPCFGSKWFDQWAKDYPGHEGERYRQAREAAQRDAPGLKGIRFYAGSYEDLEIPAEPSIVYCDPPYKGTADYAGSKTTIKVDQALSQNNWNAIKFWRWADRLVSLGHSVFVSEYHGPEPSMYNGTPDAQKALRDVRAKWQHLDRLTPAELAATDVNIFDDAQTEIRAAEDAIRSSNQLMADRWQSLWHKEVTSDFSATRGKGEEAEAARAEAKHIGKTEFEQLYHRKP